MAVGNIVGSAISNILGAFSLGLLFRPKGEPVQFDKSSRIYSLFLLIITTLIVLIFYFSCRAAWLVCGAVLITLFGAYVISIGWAISRGKLTAPEDSDTDSSDDESEAASIISSINDEAQVSQGYGTITPSSQRTNQRRRSLNYHIGHLVLGFLTICLAGYVLSHAAINVTDAIGISDVLFGVTILAIATTMPEKFVAVLSGNRGHMGILVANTVGSNVFLLLLCLGIILLETSGEFNSGSINIPELIVLWCTTLAFTITIWVGGRFDRWIGGAMLLGYIAFIVLEFTVIHKMAGVP